MASSSSSSSTPTPSTNKTPWWFKFVLIFVVVLLGLGGAYYWETKWTNQEWEVSYAIEDARPLLTELKDVKLPRFKEEAEELQDAIDESLHEDLKTKVKEVEDEIEIILRESKQTLDKTERRIGTGSTEKLMEDVQNVLTKVENWTGSSSTKSTFDVILEYYRIEDDKLKARLAAEALDAEALEKRKEEMRLAKERAELELKPKRDIYQHRLAGAVTAGHIGSYEDAQAFLQEALNNPSGSLGELVLQYSQKNAEYAFGFIGVDATGGRNGTGGLDPQSVISLHGLHFYLVLKHGYQVDEENVVSCDPKHVKVWAKARTVYAHRKQLLEEKAIWEDLPESLRPWYNPVVRSSDPNYDQPIYDKTYKIWNPDEVVQGLDMSRVVTPRRELKGRYYVSDALKSAVRIEFGLE